MSICGNRGSGNKRIKKRDRLRAEVFEYTPSEYIFVFDEPVPVFAPYTVYGTAKMIFLLLRLYLEEMTDYGNGYT